MCLRPAWMPRIRTRSVIYLDGRPTLFMHISPLLFMETLGSESNLDISNHDMGVLRR